MPGAETLDRDGWVSVVEGRFNVAGPSGGGRKAAVIVPEKYPLSVTLDGNLASAGHYELGPGQEITVATRIDEPLCSPQLRVTSDKLSVVMTLNFRNGSMTKVADSGPTSVLVLKTETTALAASPPSYEELVEMLNDGNFQGDADKQALQELSSANSEIERIVLRGRPVFPGKPAQCRAVPIPEDDSEDPLHRRMKLQSVTEGTVVAELEDEVPPRPGQDVFGRAIPCQKRLRSALPRFGEGVQEVNHHVIAKCSGRLIFTPDKLDVVPHIELNQTVTAKNGHVLFDGDVTVFGDVEDGSVVSATGIVQINGGVYGSTIIGERGVSIRGHCVKSKVYSGWGRELAESVMSVLTDAKGHLSTFAKDVAKVQADAKVKLGESRSKEIPGLPWMVLDKYHSDVTKAIHGLVQQYALSSRHELGNQLEPLIRLIQAAWVGPKAKNLRVGDIADLQESIDRCLEFVKRSRDEDASVIHVGAVTSSVLDATGDILVSGKGAYASQLVSGRQIEVKGYVRGGSLWAKNGASVDELGSPSGTETKVVVDSREGSIYVKVRNPNTLLEVSGRLDRNTVVQKEITFAL